LAEIAIDVFNPPTPLLAVKGNGNDVLGDTQRLQTIINHAIANKRDVYIPKDLVLQPILQPDNTMVCITLDDGATNGNYRKPIRIYGKKGIKISTNNTTQKHTIFRWKLGDSTLDGIQFEGTQGFTKALELSRINQNNTSEFDGTTRNKFTNLRFVSCDIGISLEGSSYYNKFENISFFSCNLCIWLKKSAAMLNGLVEKESNVNRNNFHNVSAFIGVDGIRVDYGDTNKFYSCAFEGLSGTSIALYDQTTANPNLFYTEGNGFFSVTNEGCVVDLINDALNSSFVDFYSMAPKTQFLKQPTIFIPGTGSAGNHTILGQLVQLADQNMGKFIKNNAYLERKLYLDDVSDYKGVDEQGVLRGFSWRSFDFGLSDGINLAYLAFNSSNKAVYKSMGGVVYYYAKLSIVPTDLNAQLSIPLPELAPSNFVYSYASNIEMGVPVHVARYNGTTYDDFIVPAIIDPVANKLHIKPPTGGWNSSLNVVLINLHYTRTGTIIDSN
jgi:hypothetical protein